MRLTTLQALQHSPQYIYDKSLEEVGEENADWILDNHHLYNTNEIAHKCHTSKAAVKRFFETCGICTDMLFSARYTTPRAMGEMAGKAREHGYRVEGTNIYRQGKDALYFHPQEWLEERAVGCGYKVFDEYGNELVYKNYERPDFVATEYHNSIDLSRSEQPKPKVVEPTEMRRLRPLSSTVEKPKPQKSKAKMEKPQKTEPKRQTLVEVVRTDDGLKLLSPEQCTKPIPHHGRCGYFYFENYNKGGGHVGHRYVAEIMVHRHRYRFRSTNPVNVQNWLDDMLIQYKDA